MHRKVERVSSTNSSVRWTLKQVQSWDDTNLQDQCVATVLMRYLHITNIKNVKKWVDQEGIQLGNLDGKAIIHHLSIYIGGR